MANPGATGSWGTFRLVLREYNGLKEWCYGLGHEINSCNEIGVVTWSSIHKCLVASQIGIYQDFKIPLYSIVRSCLK